MKDEGEGARRGRERLRLRCEPDPCEEKGEKEGGRAGRVSHCSGYRKVLARATGSSRAGHPLEKPPAGQEWISTGATAGLSHWLI